MGPLTADEDEGEDEDHDGDGDDDDDNDGAHPVLVLPCFILLSALGSSCLLKPPYLSLPPPTIEA